MRTTVELLLADVHHLQNATMKNTEDINRLTVEVRELKDAIRVTSDLVHDTTNNVRHLMKLAESHVMLLGSHDGRLDALERKAKA